MNLKDQMTMVMMYVRGRGYRFRGTEQEQVAYAWSVVDYLADSEMSLDEWFRETKTNYPEDLEAI